MIICCIQVTPIVTKLDNALDITRFYHLCTGERIDEVVVDDFGSTI